MRIHLALQHQRNLYLTAKLQHRSTIFRLQHVLSLEGE